MRTYTGGTILETITGGSGTFTIAGSGAGLLTSIGEGWAAFTPADMDFCEIIAYPNTLSTTDFDNNIAYLTSKWAV
jgi:hypothetical protein